MSLRCGGADCLAAKAPAWTAEFTTLSDNREPPHRAHRVGHLDRRGMTVTRRYAPRPCQTLRAAVTLRARLAGPQGRWWPTRGKPRQADHAPRMHEARLLVSETCVMRRWMQSGRSQRSTSADGEMKSVARRASVDREALRPTTCPGHRLARQPRSRSTARQPKERAPRGAPCISNICRTTTSAGSRPGDTAHCPRWSS